MGGLGALGVSTTAYGFSAPVVRLRVARYDVSPPRWPAGLQLRIAAIADLHACDPWMSLDRINEIVARTNALKPDVIVLLGDYVAGHRQVTRYIPASEWAARARRIEGAAWRACRSRQSRLVGRQSRATRRAGTDDRRPCAGGGRHTGLRKRCQTPEQGRPPVLAGRSRRSARLYASASTSGRASASASTISVRRSRRSPTTRR